MEKLDVVVAVAGALVLLAAVVGAALTDGSGAAEYDVVFSKVARSAAPLALDLSGGRATATFEVPDLNVTQVTVIVYVTATAALGGYTAHVTLAGPGGAKAEKDGSAGLAQATLAVEVTLDLPAAAHGGRARTSSAEEAIRGATVENATAAVGEWTVEVSFAPAGPMPAQGVVGVALPSWTALVANATLAAPASR